MTNREFLTSVSKNANVDEAIRQFASDELSKMDARNAARASKPSKTAIANEPIKKAIFDLFDSDEVDLTSPEVATLVSPNLAEAISTNKASALLRQLVKDGKLSSHDVKIPKKGTMKSYKLP